VRFEVQMDRKAADDWVATAVEYGVTVNGRTEQEALLKLTEALARHFKTAGTAKGGRREGSTAG
jgi:hypothetical protein